MTTNPNNAIGTNGAFGGRTSVNAFNDNLSAWTRGVMSGWACEPDSGMTVALGGDSSVRDVAIAEDDAGNKTSINNISLAPVQVTIPGAPASNTRIDSIVAYVDNPPQGTATITDNYESCGIIVVSGTPTSSPVPPNESTIRSAITADGATGATAYYVVLANVSVANGTTDITSGEIMAGDVAQLSGMGVVTANNIDFTTSTDTLTFSIDGGVTVGTATATLIPLDDNGLTMLLYNGSTGYNDGATGPRILKWDLSKSFDSVYGGSVNSYYSGNTEAYLGYSSITSTGKGECYVIKTSQAMQTRMISLTIIGIMK